jgi:hypothetical protein
MARRAVMAALETNPIARAPETLRLTMPRTMWRSLRSQSGKRSLHLGSRPRLEALEDRCLLSTVTNLLDSGLGSLRDAIATAAAGDTIDFQSNLSGSITLTSGQLTIDKDLTISGPGSSVIKVSGNLASRVFAVTSSTVVIGGLTIADGRSPTDRGGGIDSLLSNLTVTDSLLIGNSASGMGGGIMNEGGTPLTVINCTLTGNSAFDGAAIWSNGPLTITDSILRGNSTSRDGFGGAISNFGNATLTSTTLSGNTASAGGGILNSNVGTLVLIDSTLSGNTALNTTLGAGIGGGIYTEGGSVTATNCTFSGNSADRLGGGIENSFTTLTLTSCTLSGNSAGSVGGGIFGGGSLRNTIVAGNTALAAAPDVQGTVNSQGHNLIGNGDGGSGYASTDLVGTTANPIDPKLGPLQDNGGPTLTMALLPGSPAVDAGDNTGAPDFDQRGDGFSRIVGGTIDVGAFEAQIGDVTHFAVGAPSSVNSGDLFDVTVTALDAYNHVVTGYTGTVTFSTSDADPGVVLPPAYTFQPQDNGVALFSSAFSLITPGPQTITATDTSTGANGSATVTVNAPGAPGGGAFFPPVPQDQLFAGLNDAVGFLTSKRGDFVG